jgi:phenylpyruvate tautomerase PptA (4-oxalocrotonate tautomerase family)
MPLVEITVKKDKLTKEQEEKLAEAIRDAMLKKFEELTGKPPRSFYVIVRQSDTWLS